MALEQSTIPFIYFDERSKNICEQLWLEELLGRKFAWYKNTETVNFEKGTSVILYYQYFVNYNLINEWISGHPDLVFFLVHLSDETCKSDVRIYDNPAIKKVFRNYWRPDVIRDKVMHIPLGYNKYNKKNKIIKPVSERPYVWSFAGAMDRPLRKEILSELEKLDLKSKVHRTPTWGSMFNLPEEAYINLLLDTKLVPCMPGFFNVECFRFYEALECGAIPIISLDQKNSYTNILAGPSVPLFIGCTGTDWSIVDILGKDEEILKRACSDIQKWWSEYKIYLKKTIREIVFGIGPIRVINLAHRKDRMELFEKNNPCLTGKYSRFDAIHGVSLELTSEIHNLFRHNTFGWKKNVIGCALSHYRIWQEIASGELGEKVFIFEDDVILDSDFLEKWTNMIPFIPDDSDLIFLGGVLPCNAKYLAGVTEPVNCAFAKIKPNNFCGAGRRFFHFCTYSYIITKAGANKLCATIGAEGGNGIFNPIDNYIFNCKDDLLNIYFSTPLICGCVQDKDANYVNAVFDVKHNQVYDSDIRSNDTSFTQEELSIFR